MTGINTKGKQFSVEKHGVEKEVLELHKNKTPATVISKLLEQKGIKIAPLGINRWIKHTKARASQKRDLELRKDCDVIVMNYKNEITSILDEVKEMKEKCKIEGDLKIYDKMVGRLFQGLELLAKLMGDIKQGNSIDINIIINEINKKAEYLNKKMRTNLGDAPIVDVEAEIIKDDDNAKEKLEGVKNE